jgi:hypothetical protein
MDKSEDAPDIYCDGIQLGLTPFDVMIWLMRRSPEMPSFPAPGQQHRGNQQEVPAMVVGTVRISLEQAKVFAILLRKNLKDFEDKTGKIPMHPEMMGMLGISKDEDW